MFGINTYRIIGIDPSVDNMGVGILDIDIDTYRVVVVESYTVHGKDHVKKYPHIAKYHGERVAKLHGHGEHFIKVFDQWDPNAVAIETPFMGRFPAAYGALKECVCTVTNALISHDFTMPLNGIDPKSVKNAIGVSAGSKDKNDMQAALSLHKGIEWGNGLNAGMLDEHSVDAIAVAYWLYSHQFNPYIKNR